ncbi:hypothetical protein IWQ57_003688 [Coemansia nantahalensis]|uniref:Uncharacterized protein n=1 Tax=Coemansia nantahalensis TaxID=2789366 RepID=A0ACC1JVG0_9FUNG|nr:hypothetical protein IWQ57_003688 [Coemansia nantahalensis]
MSRTLLQALFRACTLLAGALKIKALELDPLSSATPYVRRLLGAIMQAQFLAQHNIQATSLGLLLHVASVVETRVCIVHEHLLQITTPAKSAFDVASRFSPDWRRLFPTTAALVLWCIDLLVALTRDTYLYFNVRCADRQGAMRPLCEADDAGAGAAAAREAACTQCFTGEQAGGLGDSCLLPGWVPSRLALLFHRPTLDAVRSLLTFAARLEADMLQRIHILNNLPPNAAAIPEYADMLQSREMLLSAAQQLAHALEYLPVGMQRLKDFLVEVEGLYADDDACMSVAAQAMLVSTSAVAGPFRKYLPQVARSFARHVLEPDATQPSLGHPAVPAALVLHDTRWIGVLACRANASGLPDGATVFETPWRVELPVVVADPRLIDADEDTLVPAAEVAEWARERSAFERALDEDNVLFDIDDPGFIFFDTSASPDDDDPPQTPAASGIFAGAVSAAAAQAPVRITTKVPDFSDVVGLYTAAERMRITDDAADHMFSMPPPFDTTYAHAAQAAFGVAADAALGALPLGRPAGASRGSSCTSPLTTPSVASASLAPRGFGPDPAGDRPRQAGAQHFVPHYSSVAVPGSGGEAGAGWQFVSMPQCPKLHIPTLLAQHACSLAVLAHKRRAQQPGPAREPVATGDCSGRGMAYCIDWSRSEGVVIESTLASGLSGVAAAAAAAVAAAAAATPEAGHGKLARPSDAPGVDGMDVVQKTMLPAGAPVKLCLRCGHLARRVAADAGGPNDVMWIRRFDVLCVCGGSWIAL